MNTVTIFYQHRRTVKTKFCMIQPSEMQINSTLEYYIQGIIYQLS